MNSKLRDVLVLVALSLALVWCIPAMGQVLKGSISGTVADPQGAVVSGAQVKATQTDTGAVYTTTSDSSGLFRFNLIPAGTYKVEISAQGFKTTVQNNVPVSPGSDQGMGSLKLAVGGASETLEVTAAAPLIETTQAQVTNTFTGVTLQTFAGVQENEGLDNLALFVPGIVSSRDNNFSNTNGGGGFSVNGIRGRNNDQEIDGQNNNDNSVAGPSLFVTDSEFVGQYVLISNNFGPEYGRNAGSVVNIITKSGGNNWHGSLYGTENNSDLNSMDNFQKQFEGLSGPPRLNNEFGGFTIGGPVVKNKFFIFGGFNEQIVSTLGNLSSGSLTPTPAGLAKLNACFPGSTSLTAFNQFGPYAISGGNPTQLGPATLVDVGACTGVPFAGVQRFLQQPVHNFNWTTRADWQLGGDTLTARYLFNRGNSFNNDFGQGAAGYPVNVPALSQAILLSETHNFTSRMVNEARVSFNRLNVDFGGNTINTVPTANNLANAVTNVSFRFNCGSACEDPAFAGASFLGLGPATNLPQSRIVNTMQFQDNWNYVLGKHSFKAGVNWTYQRSPNIFLPDINGQFRFDDWTNFVGNTPDRVRIANGQSSLDFREYDTFIYAGDDWKIGQNLTLNLGLTWTYYGQPENLFNTLTTAQQKGSTPFWNPALPLSVTTDPTVPSIKNSFGPSLGFAYNPQWGGFLTGHGKTTIRGGYRFLYDPPYYNIFINESTSSPMVFLQSLPAQATHALPTVPTGPNVRSSVASAITLGVFDPRTFAETNVSPNFGPDKVHSYSLGIEREITKNSAFEVRYSGNRAYDLFQSVNGNPFIGDLAAQFPSQVPAGLTPCPASQAFNPVAIGRVNCNEGVLLTRNNGGYSYYNGIQTELRANNLFKQLTMRMSYTYAKTLDNVSEIFSTFGGGNTLTYAQNPVNTNKGEYSFSGLDIPNTWTMLFTEQLPFFKEQHGFMGHLLGGWGLSGNYIVASGQRYTPVQVTAAAALTAPGNFYDLGFIGNFVGTDVARPFIGSLSAPASSVGVFAGDACNVFGLACAAPATQLISMNALNTTGSTVNVTNSQVRYIINASTAQGIFGTPFGNAARNLSQDAITNIGNFSVFKTIKLTERASFQFHATMLNVFNHQNFQTIDPFIEDAGVNGVQGTGFGNPAVTNTVPAGYFAPATREIIFGGTLRF